MENMNETLRDIEGRWETWRRLPKRENIKNGGRKFSNKKGWELSRTEERHSLRLKKHGKIPRKI